MDTEFLMQFKYKYRCQQPHMANNYVFNNEAGVDG